MFLENVSVAFADGSDLAEVILAPADRRVAIWFTSARPCILLWQFPVWLVRLLSWSWYSALLGVGL